MMFVLLLTGCQPAAEKTGYSGYVEAEWRYLAAPEAGWLVDEAYREGDVVEAGAVAFRLEPEPVVFDRQQAEAQWDKARALADDKQKGARAEELAVLQADIRAAEADVRLAESERQRWLKLHQEGLAAEETAERYDLSWQAAKARLAALKARLASARLGAREDQQKAAEADVRGAAAIRDKALWQEDQRSVRARVAGRVERLFYRPGEYVMAGVPVMALLPPSGLKIRFYVPEPDLARFHPGQRVKWMADGLHEGEAVVSYVAAEAEYTPPIIFSEESRQKLVFMVEARPVDAEATTSRWRAGLPVEVYLP
jgi:HlyD family secretion protein